MLVNKQLTNEEQCYKELCCAIVQQAAEDYLEAKKNLYLEGLMREPDLKKVREAKYDIKSITKFFNSEWYRRLITTIDGNVFIEMLDKEFEKRKANNFQKNKNT